MGRAPGQFSASQRIAAEAIGAALLLAAVVGSGIMAERLAGGNVALALLANTLATGAALVVGFGGVSGAHLNPAVTTRISLKPCDLFARRRLNELGQYFSECFSERWQRKASTH